MNAKQNKIKLWLEDMYVDIELMLDMFRYNLITKDDIGDDRAIAISKYLEKILTILDDVIFEMENKKYE